MENNIVFVRYTMKSATCYDHLGCLAGKIAAQLAENKITESFIWPNCRIFKKDNFFCVLMN